MFKNVMIWSLYHILILISSILSLQELCTILEIANLDICYLVKIRSVR